MNKDETKPIEDAAGRPVESPPQSLRRRLAARRLLRAETVYVAALAAYSVLAVYAYRHAYFGWDVRAARAIQSWGDRGSAWFTFMDWASVFSNLWIPHALTVATMLLFFARRRFSEGAGILLSAAGSGLVNKVFKIIVNRPRPAADLVGFSYEGPGESFPSGHVTFYVGYFGFLFFVAYALLPRGSWQRRVALVLLALPVLLVGLSRVTLRAHWPSDVAGAYLLSGVWLAFSLEMYRRWKKRATLRRAAAALTEESKAVTSDE